MELSSLNGGEDLDPVHVTVHAACLEEPSRPAVLCVEHGVGGVRGKKCDGGEMWTYGEVDAMASTLAKHLAGVFASHKSPNDCHAAACQSQRGQVEGAGEGAGVQNQGDLSGCVCGHGRHGFSCVIVGVDEGVLLVATILAAFK
jgi:hypothetical protein